MPDTAESKRIHRADRWGRTSRFYPRGDKQYVSVTTVLRAVAKSALYNWYASEERKACIATAWDMQQATGPLFASRQAFEENFTLRLGKEKAAIKKLNAAADLGSEAHKRIEWMIRQELKLEVGEEPECRDEALWAVMAYEDWRKQSNMSPIMSEEVVYSDRYEYAGTLDLAAEIDHSGGRSHAVIDFKTGKGIYLEALLQNAALIHALVEMGHATKDLVGVIVRLPKVQTDPQFEVRVIPAEDHKPLFKTFLNVLELWRFMDSRGETP